MKRYHPRGRSALTSLLPLQANGVAMAITWLSLWVDFPAWSGQALAAITDSSSVPTSARTNIHTGNQKPPVRLAKMP
jgi:hypothetical protein